MRALVLGLMATTACATATNGNGDTHKDAPTGGSSDAPALTIDAPAISIDAPPDAPRVPITVVLSQSTSTAIDAASSFGCTQTNYTRINSYFRVFHLADFGVTLPFTVSKVSFGVQQATAGMSAADQPVQVKLGSYSTAGGGTTLTGATTPVAATSTLRVANGSQLMIDVPLTGTFTADQNVIVEVAVPDGLSAQNTFFIGSNTAGESKPGYLSSSTCMVATPTSMASLAAAQSPPLTAANIVLTVTGTY